MRYEYVRRGTQCAGAKLNEKLVRLIREQHALKEQAKKNLDAQFSAEAFAKRFQVNKGTIHKVLTYATWRHA